MNKEVIRKYWKEFEHWKNGGSVLSKHKDSEIWTESTDNARWSSLTLSYVINDEYVSYRKALAEGKTVLYNNRYEAFEFTDAVKRYSIKPDEPNFKVGDYVVDKQDKCIGTVTRLNENNPEVLYHTYRQTVHKDCVRLWTLEEADDDEYVVFFDDDTTGFFVDKVSYLRDEDTKYKGWKYVYPYIGQSPKQLGLEK